MVERVKNEKLRAEILRLWHAGYGGADIALKVNVSRTRVYQVLGTPAPKRNPALAK